jgi:integrase
MRSTPTQANRILAYLSGIFSYAIGQKLLSENPCKGIKKFHEEKRERYASDDELKALSKAINEYPDQHAANAIRLLILTGARLNEVVKATWDMFDLQKGSWIKPSAHTKQKKIHSVPLSGAAIAMLAGMYEARDKGNPYLFPGKTARDDDPPKPRADLKRPWDAIKAAAGIQDFRKHDLRHSYASQLVAAGVPLFDVGKLLGHTQMATTHRYAHLADDPLRAATNKVGAKLAALEEKPTGEVVPLRKATS